MTITEAARALRERVVWLEQLPERPLRGVILANEVVDALPCRRFSCTESGVRELGMALDAGCAEPAGRAAGLPRFSAAEAATDASLTRAYEEIVEQRLPISMSTRADFGDVVQRDGTAVPRGRYNTLS